MSVQVPKGYKQTEVGVIPEDWFVQPLEEFTSFISYGFTNPMPTVKSGVCMVTAKDINNGKINFDSARRTTLEAYEKLLTAKSRPKKDDILLTKDGTLGRLALVDDRVVCINQSVAVLRPNNKAHPLFLKLLLESPRYQERMLQDAGGSTIKHIYITIVNLMPLAVPASRQEQQAIAEALSDTDALIESLEQLIAKKRQIKQGAMQELLTGQRRLPGFNGEWKVNRLGDLTQMCSGGTPSSSNPDFYNGQIPWVSISDMTSAGKYIASTEKKLTNEGFASCAAKMFPSGTVLYAMYASLGECSIANVSLCTSQAILGIQPGEKIDGEYLYYYLQFIKNSVKNMGQQGTQANLNKGMVGDFLLKTPSISEQKSIVEVLHEMDKEISNLELRLSKSQKIKQSMMQELLTGHIRLL